MTDMLLEGFSLEADADAGVFFRVLDLLDAADRFPQTLRLDRDGESITLNLTFAAEGDRRKSVLPRLRQIPGVRRVLPLTLATT